MPRCLIGVFYHLCNFLDLRLLWPDTWTINMKDKLFWLKDSLTKIEWMSWYFLVPPCPLWTGITQTYWSNVLFCCGNSFRSIKKRTEHESNFDNEILVSHLPQAEKATAEQPRGPLGISWEAKVGIWKIRLFWTLWLFFFRLYVTLQLCPGSLDQTRISATPSSSPCRSCISWWPPSGWGGG